MKRTQITKNTWYVAAILVSMAIQVCAEEMRVLVMLPYQKPSGFKFAFGAELSGAAVHLAIEDIRAEGLLPNHTLTLDYGDSQCDVVKGLGTAADMLYSRKYSLVIGPQCTGPCSHVARLSSHLNIADFTGVCQDAEMLNKGQFTTLTRLLGSFDKVGKALLVFLHVQSWQRFGLISEMHVDKIWILTKAGVEEVAAERGFTVAESLVYKDKGEIYNPVYSLREILERVAAVSRIIVLAARGDTVRELMLLADDMGLLDGRYVFVVVFYYRQEKIFGDFSWKRGDADDERAQAAYDHVIFITYYTRQSAQFAHFEKRIRVESKRLFNHTFAESDAVPYPAANLYEAMYMYAVSLREVIGEGGDIHDGRNISQRLWGRDFDSITGDLRLNGNGDRDQSYTFSQIASIHKGSVDSFDLQSVGTYVSGMYVEDDHHRIKWVNGGIPADRPECGFSNELCPPMSRETMLLIVIGAFLGTMALAFGVLFVAFFYYKRLMKKKNMEIVWRIKRDDIVFGRIGVTSASKISMMQSMDAIGSGDMVFTQTGTYKGAVVAIKTFKGIIEPNSDTFKREYYHMTQLNCSNLTKIVGLCTDASHCLVVSEYCTKGSLQDLLENSSIGLDLAFKYSLITDMLRGLTYLHESEIGYHGNLKSSNCVIDGRFIVKITDFGPKEWMSSNVCLPKDKLWTAPEILRNHMEPTVTNWRMADVYSLAIILQEIYERNGVFFLVNEELEAEEIVNRVTSIRDPPFRPTVNIQNSASPSLLLLVQGCWHDVPSSRPTLKVIRETVKGIRGPGKENFMDNLLQRMEQYATNLESLVEERTGKYLQEKKRVEELLYSILPRSIADQLQLQGFVNPESYDSVTLLFTDIKGFTNLSAASTPIQIVNMLNDLYTMFDAIIDRYDTYKVETIGDAYMVASGLPKRNTDHFCQIADLTMEMMKSVKTFHIRHMPGHTLLLRAGVHSGAVVAGVVGLKMPRYCLFGDTVNTASRMESNGEAMKIHLSETTRDQLVACNKTYRLQTRGTIPVKGKGDMMTYWLLHDSDTGDRAPTLSESIPMGCYGDTDA